MEASQTLQQLDAIENGKITNHGHKIHRLPCHPRIAHMLVMAEEQNMLPLACDLAAILEERDPLPRETGIDINLRIDALRNQRANERLQKKMSRIEKVASSYRKLLKTEPDNSSVDPYETGILLVYAYPGRIACSRPGNNAQFQLSNGSLAMAGHKDDLANEQWLAVAQINARDGMGKIFLASPLNPTNLAPMVKKKEVVEWDTQKGGLSARQELRIGSIILQSKPMKEAPLERLTEAISEAIKKEGDVLLDFNKEVKQWQNRVNSLRKWQPNMGFPDVSTPSLLATNSNWLEPYLNTIKKPEDLKKLNLLDILHHSLSQNQQLALAKLAPILIEVPSGSKMKLEYTHNGSAPVLAVRIQEVFCLADTPKVNTEKIPVLMHLLSPGYKPVQITSDLRNFWDNTYYEVRKELKGRYPKHAWPDDPWSAKAIRGTKYKPLG
jgi:ATP-dependent helicase HrpB